MLIIALLLSQANEDSWCTARLVQQPLWRSLNESGNSENRRKIQTLIEFSDFSYFVSQYPNLRIDFQGLFSN